MANILWSIINLLVLWFIGWPVAGFCAMIYIFISPFGACISGKVLEKHNQYFFAITGVFREIIFIFSCHFSCRKISIQGATKSMTYCRKELSGHDSWGRQSRTATPDSVAK